MSLVRKIAINNLILMSERMLTAAAGFFVSVWLIRYFGSEKFGIYSLVFAWFTFLNVFTPAMIEQVVAREAVRFPEQTRKYLGAGVAIKTGLAVLGWLAGVGAALLLGYPRQTIIYLAIALLGLLGNASYVLQVPQQIELKLLKPALADGLSNIFYQIGRAAMILLKLGLLPFFWLYLVFRLLQLALFLALGIEKKAYRMDLRFSYAEVGEIFRASWILLINNIFVMVISRIDQLLIYPFKGARAVGLYGSCANLTDYLIMIPAVWYLTVFPLITKYLGESHSVVFQGQPLQLQIHDHLRGPALDFLCRVQPTGHIAAFRRGLYRSLRRPVLAFHQPAGGLRIPGPVCQRPVARQGKTLAAGQRLGRALKPRAEPAADPEIRHCRSRVRQFHGLFFASCDSRSDQRFPAGLQDHVESKHRADGGWGSVGRPGQGF